MDEVLTLHKVLGRTVIELSTPGREGKNGYEDRLVMELSGILKHYLPVTALVHIKQAVKGVIRQSIELKEDLATERTMCSFFWFNTGTVVHPERVQARDPQRRDLLCLFPGISGERSVWREPTRVIIAKAITAELGRYV